MKINLTQFSLILSLIFLGSCQKEKMEPVLESAVETEHSHGHTYENIVNVVSYDLTGIQEGDTVYFDDTLKIGGSISGKYDIHGYHMKLIRDTDSLVLADTMLHYHAKSFTINLEWHNTFINDTPLSLLIETKMDHQGNLDKKTIHLNTKGQ